MVLPSVILALAHFWRASCVSNTVLGSASVVCGPAGHRKWLSATFKHCKISESPTNWTVAPHLALPASKEGSVRDRGLFSPTPYKFHTLLFRVSLVFFFSVVQCSWQFFSGRKLNSNGKFISSAVIELRGWARHPVEGTVGKRRGRNSFL